MPGIVQKKVQIVGLVVLCSDLEVSLRVVADRARIRCHLALVDIATVPAVPFHDVPDVKTVPFSIFAWSFAYRDSWCASTFATIKNRRAISENPSFSAVAAKVG